MSGNVAARSGRTIDRLDGQQPIIVHPPAQASVIAARTSRILGAALSPDVGMALWLRPAPACAGCTTALLSGLTFERVAEGTPTAAIKAVFRGLPQAARPLAADCAMLAGLFAEVVGASSVRVRLEHLADDACRCLHVDAVGLRLLCTYAGRGTEWQDAAGTVRRMHPGQVGIFKGTAWPDAAPRVPHRSPSVAHLPTGQRGRILLCLEQVGFF